MSMMESNLELGYRREAYLAVELLDAVTLTRVSEGITVTANGLTRKPILNASGFFVWLKEENAVATSIIIDPGTRPYERTELNAPFAEPVTIQLHPRTNYQFAPGPTGLRGTLIERIGATPIKPIGGAEVQLSWQTAAGPDSWKVSPTISHTDTETGDFVTFLRLSQDDKPKVELDEIRVRLRVQRDGYSRNSKEFSLRQGTVADPSPDELLIFAWDDLDP